MKLTKSQRFTAYCIMLEEMELGPREETMSGFCWLIGQIFMNRQDVSSPGWIKSINWFPELVSRKPKERAGLYWFHIDEEGLKKRIELLKQCIIETHP